jgi:hypothetical protein
MVYSTQNDWVFGLFLSFGILQNRKHDVSETRSVSVLRWGEDTYSGPLERANLNHWITSVKLNSCVNLTSVVQ